MSSPVWGKTPFSLELKGRLYWLILVPSPEVTQESMADDQLIARLLRMIYAAPTAPELWQDFLVEISTALGVANAALIGHDNQNRTHRIFGEFGPGLSEGGYLYMERYWEYDEWTKRCFPKLFADRVFLGVQVWPDRELLQSTYYNEFLKHYDIRSVASVGMGEFPRAFQGLSFYGTNSSPDFSSDQIEVFQFLLPHLRVAMTTTTRLAELESRVASLEAAFDNLEAALVLLDAFGQVALANPSARAILGQGKELYLRKQELVAEGVNESAQLKSLLAKAIGTSTGKFTFGGGVMPVHRVGKKALQILVSPLRSEKGVLPGGAVVAVFINDPERQPPIPTEVLGTLFGLTAAEARLAVTLMEGRSLSEASEVRGLSRETVKSQLSAIFSKTDTKRQGELIRLLARVPALGAKP